MLSRCSIEELVDELKRRCPHGVVIAACVPCDSETVRNMVFTEGGLAAKLGLAEMARHFVRAELVLRTVDDDDDEPSLTN